MPAALAGTFAAAEGAGAVTSGSRTTSVGNAISIHAGGYNFGGAVATLTLSDNKANTITPQTQRTIVSGSDNAAVRTGVNQGGTRGASHTVSSSDGGSATVVTGFEWSGIDSTPTIAEDTATGTGTSASGSVNATVTSLIIGSMIYIGASTTFAVSGSTTLALEVDENSDNQAMIVGYRVSQSGTQSITFSIAASRLWRMALLALEEAGGGPQLIDVGLVTETDSVLALSKAKARGVGLNTETDSVLQLARVKAKAIGLNTETDSALAATFSKAKAVGLVDETDTALPLVMGSEYPVGLVEETDSAFAIARSKLKALGLITSTEVALAMAAARNYVAGLVTETDSVFSIARLKSRLIGLVESIESTLTMTVDGGEEPEPGSDGGFFPWLRRRRRR